MKFCGNVKETNEVAPLNTCSAILVTLGKLTLGNEVDPENAANAKLVTERKLIDVNPEQPWNAATPTDPQFPNDTVANAVHPLNDRAPIAVMQGNVEPTESSIRKIEVNPVNASSLIVRLEAPLKDTVELLTLTSAVCTPYVAFVAVLKKLFQLSTFVAENPKDVSNAEMLST